MGLLTLPQVKLLGVRLCPHFDEEVLNRRESSGLKVTSRAIPPS